jgi:spore cortex formation protein SpoVR/YcgB (stage V sporulation)
MRLFRERFLNGEINVDPIIVDAEWEEYAKQYEPVELGKGTEKIFEVRATYNDLLFFEDFFTREFCEKHRFFYYETKKNWDWQHQDEKEHYVLSSRDFERIKRRLLFHFINFNLPIIEAVDANFNDNGEAYLVHQHKGVDMDWWSRDQMYMKDVLMRFFRIWGGKKMVHLETIITDKEEERPWYYSWGSNQKETKKDKLTGTRVIFSYGLVDKTGNTEGFWRKDVEKVTFPPPF